MRIKYITPFISLFILFVFLGGTIEAQDNKPIQPGTKDELFARYLSDTLNAHQKIKELLGLIQASNKEKDKSLALEEYEVAFSLAPFVGDSVDVLTPLYANFSGLLDNAGAREMAIKYAKKALEYRRKSDLNKPAFEYNLIGRIAGFYVRSREYDSALYYYKMSAQVAKNSGELAYQSAAQNNIGMLYIKEGLFDSANNAFVRALHILNPITKKSDSAFKGAILDNIADNYFAARKYTEAINEYKNKMEWSNIIHSQIGVIVSNIGIAKCLATMHNFPSSLTYLKLAESEVVKEFGSGNRTKYIEIYEAEEYYDSASGDWKNALIQKNNIQHIRDSLANEQKKNTDGLIRTLTEMEIMKAHRDIQYFQLQQAQKVASMKEEQKRKETQRRTTVKHSSCRNC